MFSLVMSYHSLLCMPKAGLHHSLLASYGALRGSLPVCYGPKAQRLSIMPKCTGWPDWSVDKCTSVLYFHFLKHFKKKDISGLFSDIAVTPLLLVLPLLLNYTSNTEQLQYCSSNKNGKYMILINEPTSSLAQLLNLTFIALVKKQNNLRQE